MNENEDDEEQFVVGDEVELIDFPKFDWIDSGGHRIHDDIAYLFKNGFKSDAPVVLTVMEIQGFLSEWNITVAGAGFTIEVCRDSIRKLRPTQAFNADHARKVLERRKGVSTG